MTKFSLPLIDLNMEAEDHFDIQEHGLRHARMKTVKGLILCAVLTTAAFQPVAVHASQSSGEAALEGCAEGAVMASVALWTTALVAAIPTGGASVAAAATVEATGGSLAIGCATGAAGRWAIAQLFGR